MKINRSLTNHQVRIRFKAFTDNQGWLLFTYPLIFSAFDIQKYNFPPPLKFMINDILISYHVMPTAPSKRLFFALYMGKPSPGNIFEYLCTPLSIKPNCRVEATGDDGFLNIFRFKSPI